ncbi:MAG: sulfotransferase [Acidimicrobiia bacterium]|nr:sulfotransferase [Acidimicrobiia bacterium]
MTDQGVTPSQAPIIVIGMHRSGTTAVTRLLEGLGVFMGRYQEGNAEAWMFFLTNQSLLKKAGGRWDHPDPALDILESSQRAHYVEGLKRLVRSPLMIGFLGPVRYLRRHRLARTGAPWGWKDPRNTITLPLWLDVFPHAKVINVTRHGVDVASSLATRSDSAAEQHDKRAARRPLLHLLGSLFGPWSRVSPVDDLDGAFELWERYMEIGTRWFHEVPPDRRLALAYEDLLASPRAVAESLAEFCGVSGEEDLITRAIADLKQSRSLAYRNDDRLAAFAESHADRLARWGYSP